MTRRPRILVCGDVMNDLLVKPLEPVRPDTDTGSAILSRPGGSAANQAAWLAAAGSQVTFAGRVGAADQAQHQAALAASGVQALLAADADAPSGAAVVLVAPDGGRTMYVDRGANLSLVANDVPLALLSGVDGLHVTGYSLFDAGPRATVLGVMAAAWERGLPVTVDPSSSAFLARLPPGAFLAWTAGATVCFPNLDEAAVITGRQTADGMLTALLERYPTVVLTCGADGVLVGQRGSPSTAVPATAVGAYDTTGAGDAFCGGFLHAWYAGGDAVAAARAGVRMAGHACTMLGARPPVDRPVDNSGEAPASS